MSAMRYTAGTVGTEWPLSALCVVDPRGMCHVTLQVEEQLVKRLYTAIAAWTASLTSYGHDAPAHLMVEEGAETRAMRPKLEVSVCYRQRCMWMCPTSPTVLQCIRSLYRAQPVD